MTAPPGPPPADEEPDRPTLGASKYSGHREAPTSPPSSPEFVAHSASQAAQDASPWATSPNPTPPGQATDTAITFPLCAHAPLTHEEAPQ